MSIIQFLRILIARRWIILGLLLASTTIATIVAFRLPARYPARARIMLDVIKPDPVTGSVIATQFVRGYTRTQSELIRDYRVAGEVVDKEQWLSKPTLIADWQKATGGNGDMRRWLAQKVIDRTKADVIESSNILEITYEAANPSVAKEVVGALRDAYIDASLRFRTDAAGRTADWYRQQADKAQAALASAESAKSNFERANGIVMNGGVETETSKLQGLQSALLQARGVSGAQDFAVAQSSGGGGIVENLKIQLAQVDDQVQQASERLGTAHPVYQGLLQRRALLRTQLARETAAARSDSGGASATSKRTIAQLDSEYRAQKALVIGMKGKLDELSALQREVDLRRAQYEKAAARTADLKLEADVNETGLVPLGDPVGINTPSFPNKPLIIGLALFGGLGLGVVVAVLVELLGRRVRGSEDLVAAAQVPVLAVIAGARRSPLRDLVSRWLTRRGAADAALQPAQ